MTKRPLNTRQHLFVTEYLVDLNATQAAIRAGYSKKTAGALGERLLKKVEVAAEVQAAMDRRAKRVEVTADYVLTTIVDTIERCRQNVEPVFEGRGDQRMPTGEFTFDSGAVLKGCELLGKHLKLFTERHEVVADVTHRTLNDFYADQTPLEP